MGGNSSKPSDCHDNNDSSMGLLVDRTNDRHRKMAAKLRDDLLMIAFNLDKTKKNVNIACVTGGATTVVGGVISGVALVLAPFTAGASAVVVGIVGGAVAGSGGGTALGAQLVRFINKKVVMKGVAKQWSAFCKALREDLKTKDSEAFQKLHDLLNGNDGINKKTILENIVRFAIGGAKSGTEVGGQIAARMAIRALTVVAISGASVLNVFLIGFGLKDIVKASMEIGRGTGCETGELVRELAKYLDEFATTGKFPELEDENEESALKDEGCVIDQLQLEFKY